MDLTKLLSMLEKRKLFFPRSDTFEDPYEGTLGKATAEAMLSSGNFKKPEHVKDLIDNLPFEKEKMFISCWYAAEHESAAMWKLYLNSNEGIAIKTKYDSLCNQLEGTQIKILTTLVNYIDYENDSFPCFNMLNAFTHKRNSFSHENELRAIIWSREAHNRPLIEQSSKYVEIEIDPASIIEAIYVSPTSPTWFGDLVEQLMKRYDIKVPIVKSKLYERPIF